MKFVLFLVLLAVIGMFVIMALYQFLKTEGLFRRKPKFSIDIKELPAAQEQVILTTPAGNRHTVGNPYHQGDDIEREVQLREAVRLKKQLSRVSQ